MQAFVVGNININLLNNSRDVDKYKVLMARYGFESHINEPTRTAGQSQTRIDHVFSKIMSKAKVTVGAGLKRADITDHH